MPGQGMGWLAWVFLVVGALAPLAMPIAFAEQPIRDCAVSSQVGETCWLRIDSIHPTQFAVGYRAVEETVRGLSRLSPQELERQTRETPAPFVIAPGGAFYIFDRHHLSTSLLQLGIREMRGEVKANWFRMDARQFFPAMQRNGWVWLYDEDGRPASPRELPTSLRRLADDPYRSLSDSVRDRGGFRSTHVPFAEFMWANFFRTRVSLGQGESGYERAVRQAAALALTPAARGLPGYRGR